MKAVAPAEANPADNFHDVEVNLVPAGTTDRVAGQVFADANGDSLPTLGEELAGVKAIAYVWTPGSNHVVTTTNANGRFSLEGIPVEGAQRHIGLRTSQPVGNSASNRPCAWTEPGGTPR